MGRGQAGLSVYAHLLRWVARYWDTHPTTNYENNEIKRLLGETTYRDHSSRKDN